MAIDDQQLQELEETVKQNENKLDEVANAGTPEPETPTPQPKRFNKTAIFSPEEFAYLDSIFLARQDANLSRDWNHFLRQCIDFAVNHHANDQSSFAVPKIPILYLNKAFYKP